jgi:hypothetical protein
MSEVESVAQENPRLEVPWVWDVYGSWGDLID